MAEILDCRPATPRSAPEPHQTTYHVTLRLRGSGHVSEHQFDSMTARVCFVLSMGQWADVVEEWLA